MRNLGADIRFAIRTALKSPGFLLVAVLSLALGIGGNTAIFTLLDQLLLRVLPGVEHPQELVLLSWVGEHYGSSRGANALSYPMYADIRDQNSAFSGMICRYGAPLSMGFSGRTEFISGELVSGNYFEMLGVKAAAGRLITPGDDRVEGGHPVAVLTYDFWKSRFALDAAVIGKTITLDGYPMTIIGVSQEGFDGTEMGYAPQVRVPVMMKARMTPGWDDLRNRRSRWVQIYGRLKPGVTREQAKAALQPLFHQIIEGEAQQKEFAHAAPFAREAFLRSSLDVLPAAKGRSLLREQFSKPLMVLMAVVALVLLIACANVANLLLAKGAARQKEITVRLALGATRFRIVQQLLAESLLLAFAGGAVGIAIAAWTDRLLLRFLPEGLLPAGAAGLTISSTPDRRVLLFTLAVSFLTGLIFGLVPALQSAGPDLAPVLKDQAGAVIGGAQATLRRLLVVGQIAVSLTLLIGAGLFIRSLRNLKGLDPGFRPQNLLSFTIDPNMNGYPKERSLGLYRRLNEELNATPGVQAAGLAVVPVLGGWAWSSTISVEGYEAKPGENMNPTFNSVSPGYFAAMGIPLLAGRDFTAQDEGNAPKVCIVNQKLARRFFGDRDPVGRHIGLGGDPGTRTDIEIVGVVQDIKYVDLREEKPLEVFQPYPQAGFVSSMTAYVRTTAASEQMFSALRGEVQNIDASLPITHMKTIEDQLDQSLVIERLVAGLSTVFGLLAVFLAVIGLYGVLAYMVRRRAREIGIRMALGAPGSSVLRLVLREVALLAGAGMAIGLAGAWSLTKLVRAQLYGVASNDPATIAAGAAALAVVALTAGFIPACRAARLDPMQVLRHE